MCGIAGIFNWAGKPASNRILQRMTAAMSHRGPDGDGTWVERSVGFGHRRLAVIDPGPRGRQPMQTPDGRYTITYNGMVYNYQNLRMELETLGHVFRSSTDTEVVLHAFQQWGPPSVEKLNGMFAYAVWDDREQRLFVARDRYGIKPLYYTKADGAFLFASEIKGLLAHPSVEADVCLPALNEYFSFQNVFSDRTLFDGIHLLPAGSLLTVSAGDASPVIRAYWDFAFIDDESISENEAEEEVTRLFEQAVNRQLVGDVEVGAYLSGGIDSGSVACVGARQIPDMKTFTCGFDLRSASGLELTYDERERAEYLSYLLKTEHYQVVLKAGDMEKVMPELIWHLEDPRVGQCYPNFYVSRLAGKFVKVILSGAGGDELFAGYPWRYYRAVVNDDPGHYMGKYYRYWQRLISDELKPDFFQPHVSACIDAYPTLEVFKQVMNGKAFDVSSPADYVNRSLYFEAKTFLHGLLQVEDKLSMAHGLEVRLPFLDNDLVDFATRVPVRFLLRDLRKMIRLNENEPGDKSEKYFARTNDGKLLLRRALASVLPEGYAHGAKQGFSAPDGSWFKGESIEYIRDLLFDRRSYMYEYIRYETACDLMDEHFSGKRNRRLLIWSFLCFEWWCRTFLAGETARSNVPSLKVDAHEFREAA